MLEPGDMPLNPDPPLPPGVPRVEDLNVPEPTLPREATPDTAEGSLEPPD
jgi:hypothetical protein